MKKIYPLFLIFFIALLAACERPKAKVCISPENPYDEGSGHYAGYNWAVQNGSNCDGNSDSFNEGCAEYYDQLNQYETCLKQQ